jgi:hypothetical protein
MIKALLTAVVLALSVVSANANTKIPDYLVGDWCQTSGNNTSGDYIKAKNFCKETRPVAFIVRSVGFWIKLSGVKTKIICAPTEVELFAHGWIIAASCGAEDNSTGVYQMEFVFEQYGSGPMTISSTR